MKSAGGVANNNFRTPCLCRGNRVVYNSRGVCALFVLDNINACALCPNVKLVYCRRPEGVGRGKNNAFALRFIHSRHFAYGGGFADAVDANHKDY